MALVRCPECGHENVSDSAVACPECGYGIREHFEKIREKEKEAIRQKQLEERLKQAEQEEKLRKEEEQRKELEELEKIPLPEQPTFSTGILIYLGIVFVVLLAMGGGNLNEPEVIMMILGLFLMLGGIPLAVYIFGVYREKCKDYTYAINNPTEYRKKQQGIQRYNENLRREEAREYFANQNCKPKCPTCGCTNVRRTAGGHYTCNQCHYKW